ncbi:hypothetical protein J4427_00055 [Candidatus Woesearchaeota archaeon]|nr:hypothetical protein [Candidatus Woesearchaeota archaeon]
MNKKGISPLIATVLIIGFTIVLAVVVMQWGNSFVKSLTEQQQVQEQIGCQMLSFSLDRLEVDETNNLFIGTLTNERDKRIEDFIIQWIKEDETVRMDHANSPLSLDPYQTRNERVPLVWFPANKGDRLRFIPVIKVNDKLVNCSIDYAKEKVVE